jgi:hypothetical protein
MRGFAWVCVVVGILLAAARPVLAEPPAGFADLPWGTRSDKVDAFMRSANLCGGERKALVRSSAETAVCLFYTVPGVGEGTAFLHSLVPPGPNPPRGAGTLAGYGIALTGSSYAAFRTVVIDKFGPPHQLATKTYKSRAGASVTGEELTWRWPAAAATLTERSESVNRFCLDVRTPALEAQRAEQARREREKAKRSF